MTVKQASIPPLSLHPQEKTAKRGPFSELLSPGCTRMDDLESRSSKVMKDCTLHLSSVNSQRAGVHSGPVVGGYRDPESQKSIVGCKCDMLVAG